jgi:hypothetical protein
VIGRETEVLWENMPQCRFVHLHCSPSLTSEF